MKRVLNNLPRVWREPAKNPCITKGNENLVGSDTAIKKDGTEDGDLR